MNNDSNLYEVTSKIIETLQGMGLTDTYFIAPAKGVHPYLAYDYWEAMLSADTLKYRWSDIQNPVVGNVLHLHADMLHSYFVVCIETGKLVAEFSLDYFSGKAAQVHFSMRPDTPTKLKLWLADNVSNQILNNWAEFKDMKAHFIDTIFGVTPEQNRVACIFIQKAGFKRIGMLHSGTKYLNKVDNALITQKSRNY